MNALHGQWHDGASSRPRAVRLWLAAPGVLRIEDASGGVEDWPLSEVRPSPRLGSTPRLLRRAGHGQIECADDPLLARWFPRPVSRVEASVDWLERRKAAIAVAALVAALAVFGFFRYGVPALALRVAERVPRAVEVETSRQVAAVLQRTHLEQTALPAPRRRQLQAGFLRLVEGQPRHRQMQLHFVRAPTMGPNAFALPDGSIYLTDALVELAEDDDQILAVLAHEAGHHVHRHGMRQAIESASVLLLVGMLAGDVSGSSLSVSLPAVLLQSGFSRGHEREADAYALALLRARGISPSAFAGIMRRLASPTPAAGAGAGYLSTHPPTPERIEAAERAAAGDR